MVIVCLTSCRPAVIVQGGERSWDKVAGRPRSRLRNRQGVGEGDRVRVASRPQSTVGVAAGGAVMIRGPRRGLGTFRCRCRRSCSCRRCHWSGIWVLPSLLLLLLSCLAAARVPPSLQSEWSDSSKGSVTQPRFWPSASSALPATGSVAEFTSPSLQFQSSAAFSRPGAAMAAMSSSGSSGIRDSSPPSSTNDFQSPFQQQIKQQQPAAVTGQHQQNIHHSGSGYKHPASSSSSGALSGSTAKASGGIIRLMNKRNMYLQIFPNGTVSTTSQDSTIYSKSTHI